MLPMNPLHDPFGDPHNTSRNDATDQVEELSDRVVRVLIFLAGILASAAMWWPAPAQATRIKEVATIQGVRSNPTKPPPRPSPPRASTPCCSRWA